MALQFSNYLKLLYNYLKKNCDQNRCFLRRIDPISKFLPRVMIAFYFPYNNNFEAYLFAFVRWVNRTFSSLLNFRSKLFKPRRYQHHMNRISWLVHYGPGLNKLSNENSYARLTDRERSVLAGDRAMYPPWPGDWFARRRIQREIEREERESCGWGSDVKESGCQDCHCFAVQGI